MKEASGEANMTVITIALIAVVAAVGTPLIKGILNSTSKSSCCVSLGGTMENGTCVGPSSSALSECMKGN